MRWVPEQGELSCSVHYHTSDCLGPADSQLSKVCLTEGFGSCSTTGTSQSLKKEQQEEDGWSGIGGARSPPAAADTSTDSPAGDSEGNFHPSFPHSYEQRHHEETTSSDTRFNPHLRLQPSLSLSHPLPLKSKEILGEGRKDGAFRAGAAGAGCSPGGQPVSWCMGLFPGPTKSISYSNVTIRPLTHRGLFMVAAPGRRVKMVI
uniref:uncharacterized protein LOC122778602 isoform X2 n=1 Tax=Solea senegalensis TaxID=28829 RepID=UPI001CD847BA|nr:uncharacterized protein LOC122778602 isoform X2 [Solea senegalensis]